MELKNLHQQIRQLVTLEKSEAPLISCYLNLENGVAGYRVFMDERIALLRKSFSGNTRRTLEEAFGRLETYLANELQADAKGAAVFVRGGKQPFFLPLQFRVPLPNWLAVDEVPNVYHLVELKDTYHRYVVVMTNEESARIFEVNLGAVTEQIWKERPELRDRVDHGWTKEHYQHHRREQAEQFIKEKIKIVDRLMSAGGHTHLILAGEPRMVSRLQRSLPKHLAAKVVDIVAATPRDSISDIVAATISAFVEREEVESQAMVDRLQHELNTNGLAAVGTTESLNALRWGQADVLVLAKAYESETGWACVGCGAMGADNKVPAVCPECGEKKIREVNVKEEMVRLAEKNNCKVEIVNHSDMLMAMGGVGCLLRYQLMMMETGKES